MHRLSVDIETYSDQDIRKTGSWKYALSPSFDILLIAYALDNDPVQIIDLTEAGTDVDKMMLEEFFDLMYDEDNIISAYNASFEYWCFKVWMSRRGMETIPISRYQCTMVHGMYCGYTAGLGVTGEVLGLPQDKKKLTVGSALIRKFCVPQKPTKSDPHRTRIYPSNEPEKWELFKTYCINDVEAEREIERRLSVWPMPEQEQKQWQLDIIGNEKGVGVDMDLVESAIELNRQNTDDLVEEAKELTGLSNPNSVSQLIAWLKDDGTETSTLRKADVADLLGNELLPEKQRRVLEIRQQLGKTSCKKYDAVKACVCEDGRVRGITQFYGANRTGRFCLTGDHEVLTLNGWVRMDEWDGSEIACWNPCGEVVSFDTVGKVEFCYEGPMYHISDARIDQISTPEHKMYVKRSRRLATWEPMTVEEMQKHRCVIPLFGYRNVNRNTRADEFRVLVMTQADGHYTEDGQLVFNFKKERKIERCKMLLRRCGITHSVTVLQRGVTRIAVPARLLPLWLRQFKDKNFRSWLFDENADVFFDELPNWDGYKPAPNSIQYCTSRKGNADIIQALAHMSGRTAVVRKKKFGPNRNPNWSDAWVVDIWENATNTHEITSKAEVFEYDGKVYCAVTKTGYFLVRRNGKVWVTGNSGRLVQLQNLPQNHLDDLAWARQMALERDSDALKMMYGESIPDTLSQLIRTMFVPSAGKKYVIADFSAIEARVIAWLAGEKWVLDTFRNGGDIYCATASQMFGVPVEKHGRNAGLRQKGKVAVLGLGYAGGEGALKAMGADRMGLSDEEITDIKNKWRKANPHIVEFWYDVGNAAMKVLETNEPQYLQHGLVFRYECDADTDQEFLTIELPSKRKLFYARPFIDNDPHFPGRQTLFYYGQNQTTKKWEKVSTHGGKLVENIVQASARDLLCHVLTKMYEAGYTPVFHVHDEVIIEADAGTENEVLDLMLDVMANPPAWAKGLPLKGAGFTADFYQKD